MAVQTHLAIVASQVAYVLTRVGVVDGDGGAVHRCKVLPTRAEHTLPAALHVHSTHSMTRCNFQTQNCSSNSWLH